MSIRKRSWTNEDLVRAVSISFSIRNVLKELNLAPAGGNYSMIQKYIKELNIDTSHFTGKGWNKGKRHGVNKKNLEDLLIDNSYVNTSNLRKRLISAGYLENKCSRCGLGEWLGSNIPLELDHINGIRTDNRISNLRILCPNCHALTDTYRGKNINKRA